MTQDQTAFYPFGFESPFDFAEALMRGIEDHNETCDAIDRWNDDGACYMPWPYGCAAQ